MSGAEPKSVHPAAPRLPDGKIGLATLFGYVWRLGWRDRMTVLGIWLAVILVSSAVPIFNAKLFDSVIPSANVTLLLQLFALALSFAIGKAVLDYTCACLYVRIGRLCQWHLRTAIMERIMGLPSARLGKFPPAWLNHRVNSIPDVVESFTAGCLTAFANAQMMLPALILMLIFSMSAAGFFLLYFAVFAAIEVVVLRIVLRCERETADRRSALIGLVVTFLAAGVRMRSACAEDAAFRRIGGKYAELKRQARTATIARAVSRAFASTFALVLIVFLGLAASNVDGSVSASDFAGFVSAAGFFAAAVVDFVSVCGTLAAGVPKLDRATRVLDAISGAVTRPMESVSCDEPLKGGIELERVSLVRDGARPALTDVSLKIEPGEFVAITGPSGSGKSALARLLLGLDSPDRGTVRYDGVELRRRDLRRFRRDTSAVLQGACRRAEASDGVARSDGERQRELVDRALARRARVVVLDEATEDMDNVSAREVRDALVGLADATRVVVTRRVGTLKAADRVYVLDGGRIVAAGKYDELKAGKAIPAGRTRSLR